MNFEPLSNWLEYVGVLTSTVGYNPGRGLLCEYVLRVSSDVGTYRATLIVTVDTPCNNVSKNGSAVTAALEDMYCLSSVCGGEWSVADSECECTECEDGGITFPYTDFPVCDRSSVGADESGRSSVCCL